MRDGVSSSSVALGSHAIASGPTNSVCPLTRTSQSDDHGGTPRPYYPFTSTSAVEPASERINYLPSTPSLIPRIFTPQLPPELWLLILSYASTAAGDFTTEHGIYPSEDPVLYPSFPHRHPNAELLASYSHRVKFRSHLTKVCRLWNQIGQEMLWSEVWIAGSRDGRRVRWRLEGLAYVPGIRERAMDERARINAMTMEDKFTESNPKTKAKWWNIGWGKKKTTSYDLNTKTTTSKPSPTSSLTLTHTHISQQSPFLRRNRNAGPHIRYLRIETRLWDECSPEDLLVILRLSTKLEVFEDLNGTSCDWGRLVVPLVSNLKMGSLMDAIDSDSDLNSGNSGSMIASKGDSPEPGTELELMAALALGDELDVATPDTLTKVVLSKNLKKLKWKNYETDNERPAWSDSPEGSSYFLDVNSPARIYVN